MIPSGMGDVSKLQSSCAAGETEIKSISKRQVSNDWLNCGMLLGLFYPWESPSKKVLSLCPSIELYKKNQK